MVVIQLSSRALLVPSFDALEKQRVACPCCSNIFLHASTRLTVAVSCCIHMMSLTHVLHPSENDEERERESLRERERERKKKKAKFGFAKV